MNVYLKSRVSTSYCSCKVLCFNLCGKKQYEIRCKNYKKKKINKNLHILKSNGRFYKSTQIIVHTVHQK